GGTISQSTSLQTFVALALVPRPLSPRTLVGNSAAGAAGPPLSVRFVFPAPAAGAPEKPLAMIVSGSDVKVSVIPHTPPGAPTGHAGTGFRAPNWMRPASAGLTPTTNAVAASAPNTASSFRCNICILLFCLAI